MIVDAILELFKSVVVWILGLFPNANLSVSNADWSQYLVNANQFVNMPLLMSLISVFVAYEAGVLTVRLVLWLWNTLKP